MSLNIKKINQHKYLTSIFFIILFFVCTYKVDAATLGILPSSLIPIDSDTFIVKVALDTDLSVNAISGEIKFQSDNLSLVSISKDSSIVDLWIEEPQVIGETNSVSFAGLILGGYTGKTGEVMSLLFKYKNIVEAVIELSNGSTLANDGYGTELYEKNIINKFTVLSIDKRI